MKNLKVIHTDVKPIISEVNSLVITNDAIYYFNQNNIEFKLAAFKELSEAIANKANIASVPTKVSELDNDTGFITETGIPTAPLSGNYKLTSSNGVITWEEEIVE